ncbi:hypothetical protein AMECASPLE_008993 [Ameca splendens]|uniref:Uncharacterized protein n=1 Tax=Ameca splendens TaxID=208324 RepID=A0ABV0Z8X9_9TELE
MAERSPLLSASPLKDLTGLLENFSEQISSQRPRTTAGRPLQKWKECDTTGDLSRPGGPPKLTRLGKESINQRSSEEVHGNSGGAAEIHSLSVDRTTITSALLKSGLLG